MIINHQVDMNAAKTFKAKLTFERKAQSRGVVIKGYHTDNGIFNASYLLLLFPWPLVCEVCPNYEAVMFQPWTWTPTDLGSVANYYVAILI